MINDVAILFVVGCWSTHNYSIVIVDDWFTITCISIDQMDNHVATAVTEPVRWGEHVFESTRSHDLAQGTSSVLSMPWCVRSTVKKTTYAFCMSHAKKCVPISAWPVNRSTSKYSVAGSVIRVPPPRKWGHTLETLIWRRSLMNGPCLRSSKSLMATKCEWEGFVYSSPVTFKNRKQSHQWS